MRSHRSSRTPTWWCWYQPSSWQISSVTSPFWSSRASVRWSFGSFCCWAPPSCRCSSWSSFMGSQWPVVWRTLLISSPWSSQSSTSVWLVTRAPRSCWGCLPAQSWGSCACPWATLPSTPSVLYLWASSASVCCLLWGCLGLNAPCFSTGCKTKSKRSWQKWPPNLKWTTWTPAMARCPLQRLSVLYLAGRTQCWSRCCWRCEVFWRGQTWDFGPCGGFSTPRGTIWCCSTFISCGTKWAWWRRTSTFTTGQWRLLPPSWVRHLPFQSFRSEPQYIIVRQLFIVSKISQL